MGLFGKAEPRIGTINSEAELKKFTQGGHLQNFLRFQSSSAVHVFEDFTDDTWNTDRWVATAGGTATIFAIAVDGNGVLRHVHGTTAATSGGKLASPAMWYGDRNCGFEIRYRTSVITEQRIEIGFANDTPVVDTPVVSNLVTPTFATATNIAAYVYDHATATTTTGLYSDGTGATAAAAKQTWTTNRPVADTWQTVRFQALGNTNKGALWVDGRLLSVTNTVLWEGGTANLFFVQIERSDTTDANFDIDYIRLWQERV